jgi:hypothetical protein
MYMEFNPFKGFPIEGKRHMKELKNKFDIGFNEINHKIDKLLLGKVR